MILDGIRVVDLTAGIAGPVATRLLAEAGAEVVKIEPPQGDPERRLAGFATWNRSKSSVCLDLDAPEDLGELHRLLAASDVLVVDHPGRAASLLGIDGGGRIARHPHLIVSTVAVYPNGHPDADRDGSDLLVQARLGMAAEQEAAREGPAFVRLPVPSWGTAYLACAGILARLHVRDLTGQAGPVRTSLLQGALSCLTLIWNDTEHPSDRMAAKFPMPKRPSANIFRCADGTWIHVAAGYWGLPLMIETLADMKIVPPEPPVDPGPDFAAIYQRGFDRHDSTRWLTECRSHDIAAEAIVQLGAPIRDQQAIANGYTVEIDDPQWGRCRQAGLPFHCDPPLAVRGPAPRAGEHQSLLDDLGVPRSLAPTNPDADLRAGPLSGLKVLDLGMYVGGPLGTALLADLGAEVIKLEPPTGDRMRLDELMLLASTRGKRSISIDLKNPASREVFHRLLTWADVVHHNLRFDAATRLGLDIDSIHQVNPAAILCHVSAFGPAGAKRAHSSFDPQMQAASGWMLENAGPANRPIWLRCAPTDVQCAQLSVIATLLALRQRARTGKGSAVEVSMLGGALLTNGETLLQLENDEFAPYPRLDERALGVRLGYRLFEAADGWLAVTVPAELEATAFATAFGTDEAVQVESKLHGLPIADGLRLLRSGGIMAEAVGTDPERAFFHSTDNLAAGLIVTHDEHPVYGRISQVGAFWDFGDISTSVGIRPPATLGQHTREVLLEFGYSRQEVLELSARGVAYGDAIA